MTEIGASHSYTGLKAAAILLGLGLGGFFDGIVLHQILQWHHMICDERTCVAHSIEDLQRKTFFDGLFHAGCWVLSVAGLVVLSRSRLPTEYFARRLFGWAFAGWGAFNLVEGIVDHQILGIHHVKFDEHTFLWDMAFLAWGALMLVGGWIVARDRTGSSAPVEAGET
jgi:uncharacterized membrane protein